MKKSFCTVAILLLIISFFPTFLTANAPDSIATPQTTQTVPSVRLQFLALKHHGEALGFHLGAGTPEPSIFNHYQGIQRKTGLGVPYFFISKSDAYGFGIASLLIVKMGSRDTSGERLRSNRLAKNAYTQNTAPPLNDAVVHNIDFAGSNGWPAYAHAGGMQIVDNVLAVSLEEPQTGFGSTPPGMILLVDVSVPESPTILHKHELGHKAGAVAVIKETDGQHYLMAVMGLADNKKIMIYESNGLDIHNSNFKFSLIEEWFSSELEGLSPDSWHEGAGGYQSINFVRQSDGRLFLVGTRHDSLLSNPETGEDWAELYAVEFRDGQFKLIYQAGKHFYCEAGGNRYGNFIAAAGAYVSPSGEFILYSTPHYNDGPLGSVSVGEFRHQNVCRDYSPLLRASATAIPQVVEEGGSVILYGECFVLPPVVKVYPWLEIFDDDHFNDRSLVFDWEDYTLDDYFDLTKHDDFDNKASSVRWFAPVGFDFYLCEHDAAEGECLLLHGTGKVEEIADLSDTDFGDKTSSIFIFLSDFPSEIFSVRAFKWDLNNDGVFETVTEDVEFDATNLDGPSEAIIGLQTWSCYDMADEIKIPIRVANVDPTVDLGFTWIGGIHEILTWEGIEIYFCGSFIDPGVDDTHAVEWNFGGFDVSETLITSYVFGDNGLYTVNLTVTDDDGGEGFETMKVLVYNEKPSIVDISLCPPNQNIPEIIRPLVDELLLEAKATDPGSDDLRFTWDWGDGTQNVRTLLNNPSGPDPDLSPGGTLPYMATCQMRHVYSEPGEYKVTLAVEDDDGGVQVGDYEIKVVSEEDATSQKPIANFTESLHSAGVNTPVDFNPSSSSDSYSTIVLYEWDWDGDGIYDESYDHPASVTHAYSDPGTYIVTLRVTNDNGKTDTASDIKTITEEETNYPPTIGAILGPTKVYRGDTVTFTTTGSDSEGNYPLTYEWTINGYDMGFYSPTLSFVHTMEAWSVGENTVAVRATDSLGAISNWVVKGFITLNHAPTVNDVSGHEFGYRGQVQTFAADVSDPEEDSLIYMWYVDGVLKSTSTNFSYAFDSGEFAGYHVVSARVRDALGAYSNVRGHLFCILEAAEAELVNFPVSFKQKLYVIETRSNSSLTDFVFDQSMRSIRFIVNGTSGTKGFCNILIPSALMSGDFTVIKDDVQLAEGPGYTKTFNGTYYSLSMLYEHSTHKIEIVSTMVIPDFASSLFFPFMFIATLITIALGKRLKKQQKLA
jgi:PKD repeat protein